MYSESATPLDTHFIKGSFHFKTDIDVIIDDKEVF